MYIICDTGEYYEALTDYDIAMRDYRTVARKLAAATGAHTDAVAAIITGSGSRENVRRCYERCQFLLNELAELRAHANIF